MPESKIALRCNNCRSFANPFYVFLQNGKIYLCNICGYKGDVPSYYFSDYELKLKKKIELNYTSYDIIVGSE